MGPNERGNDAMADPTTNIQPPTDSANFKILTDAEKFAIREYISTLESEREDKRRGRFQLWLAAIGLTGAGLLSGIWVGTDYLVKSSVNSEIERNQYIQTIQTKLNDSVDNLINARTKHADAQALSSVTLKEAERILAESNTLLVKIKTSGRDFEEAQPIVAAVRSFTTYSAKLATDLSNNPTFVEAVAKSAIVPHGAVVAFNLSTDASVTSPCPKGWASFQPASGRFLLGAGKPEAPLLAALPSYSEDRTKAVGGVERVRLTEAQLPTFRVTYPAFRSNEFSLQNSGYPGYRFVGQAAREATKGASGALVFEQSDPVGGGQEIDIRPPYIALYFCIKD
jgi:hypothetical protein